MLADCYGGGQLKSRQGSVADGSLWQIRRKMEEMLLFSCFVCAFRMDLTVSLRVLLLSPVAKGLITALAWKPLERNATFRPSIAALDFLFKLPKKIQVVAVIFTYYWELIQIFSALISRVIEAESAAVFPQAALFNGFY